MWVFVCCCFLGFFLGCYKYVLVVFACFELFLCRGFAFVLYFFCCCLFYCCCFCFYLYSSIFYFQNLDPVCHQLFEFYRSNSSDLRRFSLEFIPTTIYFYLSSLSQNEKKVGTIIVVLLSSVNSSPA